MEYEVHQRDGFVEVVTRGDGDVAVFQRYLDEVLALKEWRPGTPSLNDHSGLNAGPLTVNEIKAIAGMVIAARDKLGPKRLAVVAARDLEYGLARMWEVFVEGNWDGTARVFRSREEAVRWLTQR